MVKCRRVRSRRSAAGFTGHSLTKTGEVNNERSAYLSDVGVGSTDMYILKMFNIVSRVNLTLEDDMLLADRGGSSLSYLERGKTRLGIEGFLRQSTH